MKNYLDYFIPKYLNAPGPLPGLEERNGILYMNGQVVGEKPLSAKDPLLSLWVEGATLGKPLEWAGRGLWAGAKFVAPKTTKAIAEGIGKIFSKFKKPSNINLELTDRFLKFAEASPSKDPNYILTQETISLWPYLILLQAKLLLEAGVDISKLRRIDIENAMNKRWVLLLDMSNKERIVRTIPENARKYTEEAIEGGKTKGRIKLDKYPDDNLFHVGMITSFEPNKGIGRDLYDAAITTVKQDGYPGIISGENLVSAEKTISTWRHYLDKILLSNKGILNTASGKSISGTPVYLLQNPSRRVATKSRIFKPEIIDLNGKMHIDLSNPDIYKTIIPLLWETNLMQKENSQKTN